MIPAVLAYVCLVVVMSVVSFAVYGWDKRRAALGGRRIPERNLHILAFLGGWPGAWLGQRRFRHKTKKFSFLIVFWALAALHVAVAATVLKAVHTSLAAEAGAGSQPITSG